MTLVILLLGSVGAALVYRALNMPGGITGAIADRIDTQVSTQVQAAPIQESTRRTGSGSQGGKKSRVTPTMAVNANFYSKGAPAWRSQPGGQHFGTDYTGPRGTAVYAPFDMSIIKIGAYADSGRAGDYVMGTLPDGAELYLGHLQNVQVRNGQKIPAGTQIAEMNNLNHTHVQLRVGGKLTDFEAYYNAR